MACHDKLSAWHAPPGREWYQVLEIVEQVVREAQELSEEEEEESVSEETSLPEAQSTPEPVETLQVKREAVALAELEAWRARVQAAADVARIPMETLRDLGLCVSDHDLLLAKNTITEVAFGAQSRL